MNLFAKPVLFGCNQCGECCRQVQVPLCHLDLIRLQKRFVDKPLSSWLQLHPIEREHPEAILIEGKPVLLMLRSRLPEGGCLQLDGDSCSIHPDRPLVCRTFPFARRGQQLKIAPEFELLVSLACDKTPYKHKSETLADIERSDQAFIAFRQMTRQWNQEMANHSESQTLSTFLDFIDQSAAYKQSSQSTFLNK